MKKILILLVMMFVVINLCAQSKKEKEEAERMKAEKISGINDRAGGIHNASNIGLFFENRGKFYPRRVTQGPSGEFPINSTKHYIYRVNPWVGIPGNVVQALHTTNEEWEAVGGYHNKDLAQIAFSDNPQTWHPVNGWPVKDKNGNNVFISDQDSYCVYSDSNNNSNNVNRILGLQVIQTGYAFGVNFAKNILFYKFQIVNKGNNNLEKLFFALYSDIDVGNISGGTPEYSDDKINFMKDRNLVYFYDDGISPEWPGGKTGFFGVMFLKTPSIDGKMLGITDMHYNLYDDDRDQDSIQFGIMSSSASLYNSSLGSKFFHLGNSSDLHYDDVNTIPASGLDLVATLSSGPYDLNIGDTLTFITAFVAGENLDELLAAATTAQNTVNANFNLPKPPERPKLFGIAGDNNNILYWNDKSELNPDPSSGEFDFEGYRIYRSKDKGINWDKIAGFDVVNGIGDDTGIQYSFVDSTIINGFEYWYTITAFDKGNDLVASLESPLGNTLSSENTISLIPRSDAIGRSPVSGYDIKKTGNGFSNYDLTVEPIDDENLAGNKYDLQFNYAVKKESGNPETKVTITITDSTLTKPYKYGIKFNASNNFDLLNLTEGTTIRAGYNYPNGGRDLVITGHGLKISMRDDTSLPADKKPEMGDLITINFAADIIKNNSDTVLYGRPFNIGKKYSTNDGVIFSLDYPDIIKSVSRIGGTDNVTVNFTVTNDSLIKNNLYEVSILSGGIIGGNGFVIISVSNTTIVADTVFNNQTFSFDGITGKITFSNSNPPSAGNKFSVEVQKPVEPNILDKYEFKIKGSSISRTEIKKSLSKIKVVPNPYIVSSLYEPEFGELRKEPLRQIQFINLPAECTIHIFTIDADRVKTIYHNSTNGTEVWDLRTESGRVIAPGVYIYVVKTKTDQYMERFAVIK
jgi:hypothetical protein